MNNFLLPPAAPSRAGGAIENFKSHTGSDGKQMTHAWMEITSGRWQSNDGGTHNLELVANMLCEIVGFDVPFPNIFDDEGLSLEMPQEMASSSILLQLVTITMKDSELFDPEDAFQCSVEAEAQVPLPPDSLAVARVEAEAQVSLPSDSLAVGSALNSKSVNRLNLGNSSEYKFLTKWNFHLM